MIIKLKLSTGREIELTQEEYEELVKEKEKEYVYVPYQGTCPAPWWNPGPYTYPIISSGFGACSSDCIGDKHV